MQIDKILSVLYTGRGSYKTSSFVTSIVDAITIDLENMTILKLSDCIDVDKKLINQMKILLSVTNESISDDFSEEDLLEVVQIVVK